MRRRGFAMAVGVQDPLALHRSETCFGKPVRPPPSAKTTEASAREAVAELWPSPGKLFREARRASPQRQNDGARACDGAGLPRLSRKLRPSPGKLFREAQRASSQRQNYGSERERRAPSKAVAEASAVAQKIFSGSDPSVKTTGTSFRAARRARPKPKPSTILRIAKNGTRHARAGFLRTLNPKRF